MWKPTSWNDGPDDGAGHGFSELVLCSRRGCGHTVNSHSGADGECTYPGCRCPRDRSPQALIAEHAEMLALLRRAYDSECGAQDDDIEADLAALLARIDTPATPDTGEGGKP